MRQSILSKYILVYLEDHRPDSIQEMADLVEVFRPSASRAINKLRKEGFVALTPGGYWVLTEKGRNQAKVYRDEIGIEIIQLHQRIEKLETIIKTERSNK